MTDEDKEIASWVSDKMPQLVKDLTRICRIPSVAVVPEDKKPPYGPECVRVLDEMLQIGREYGLDTKNFDSCVGRIRYGDGDKSIGIWSHLDVVPVGGYWEHDPFEPVVEQGYMIARGCQDNKSSAAMALYVLLYMKEHKIKLPYSLDAYMGTCEEVGMFDIDHFKNINDTFGHPCGDFVLRQVANSALQTFRKTDTVFRYGGEEFVVILTETDIEQSIIPLERFRKTIETLDLEYQGQKVNITVSIGACQLTEETSTKEELLEKADTALYKAKNCGRNQVILNKAL
mgnify:CR=1 FL=1